MNLSFANNTKKSSLYKEYKKLEVLYAKEFLYREQQQNSYTKRLKVKNNTTGEITGISAYAKNLIKSNQANMQKSSAIVEVAKNAGLIGIFITLTNDSSFQPFSSFSKNGLRQYRINANFKYNSIDEAILKGYKNLNTVFRNFYKRVKEIDKNIYYICSIEAHKQYTPHLHLLLFIDATHIESVRKVFARNIKYYKLSRVDFQVLNDANNESALVASYIRKYMFKTLYNSNDEEKQHKQSYMRVLDGWAKRYKIKRFRMSNLPLSLDIYKKLYHSLSREYLNGLIEKLSLQNKSLFAYFMENISISKTTHNIVTDTYTQKSSPLNGFNKEFEVAIYIQEQSIFTPSAATLKKQQKIIQFTIHHCMRNETVQIYNKQNYEVIDNFSNQTIKENKLCIAA